MKKRIAQTAVALVVLFGVSVFLLFSLSPITIKNKTLSPRQVAEARVSLERFSAELKSEREKINLVIYQSELDALSDLAAHTFQSAQFENFVSEQMFTSAVSINLSHYLSVINGDLFLNAYCAMKNQQTEFVIDHCKIGKITISESIATSILFQIIEKYTSPDTAVLSKQLFSKIRIKPKSLLLATTRPPLLSARVKKSLDSFKQKATSMAVGSAFNSTLLAEYLALLKDNHANDKNLAAYIGIVFSHANSKRLSSESLNVQRENKHALWALAAYFGDRKFAAMAGFPLSAEQVAKQTPTLSNRTDLTLHFLYSAILEQVGGADVGLNIGEIKELNDANFGGSGYSFADLAADKAGIKFSQFIVGSTQQAIQAQQMLKDINEESVFFPSIEALPEGLSIEEFKVEIGDIDSVQYSEIESIIDERIAQLSLYQ